MKKNAIVLIIVLFSILVLCSCGLGSSRLEGVFEGTNIVGTHEIYSFAKDGSFRNDYETGVVIGTYHIGEDGSLDIVKDGISQGYTYKLDKDTLMIYPSGETYGSVYERVSNAPQTADIKKYESDQIEGLFGDEKNSYVFNKDGNYRHQYISHRTFSDEICVENGTYEIIDGILTLNNDTDAQSYILEKENDMILFSITYNILRTF
ncbi:MAG: hypothetical protein IJU93_00430 [Lachnospiraceae bacterium]|nr:hypothetical protein [Lachnospiraceae bacterium]